MHVLLLSRFNAVGFQNLQFVFAWGNFALFNSTGPLLELVVIPTQYCRYYSADPVSGIVIRATKNLTDCCRRFIPESEA